MNKYHYSLSSSWKKYDVEQDSDLSSSDYSLPSGQIKVSVNEDFSALLDFVFFRLLA